MNVLICSRRAAVAVFAILSVCVARADLTTVHNPPGGEASHVTILNELYGAGFSAINTLDGVVGYTNGSVTAMRVDDLGVGNNLNTYSGNAIVSNTLNTSSGDDQVWAGGQLTVVARARFAGFNQAFGYMDDDGYHELFEHYGNSNGFINDLSAANIDLTGRSFVWVRSNANGAPTRGTHSWSSRLTDNYDQQDHMITYQINGLDSPGNVWLLLWEDLPGSLGQSGSDRDFNDFGVEIQSTPAPGALLLGAMGLSLATRYRKRRAAA